MKRCVESVWSRKKRRQNQGALGGGGVEGECIMRW